MNEYHRQRYLVNRELLQQGRMLGGVKRRRLYVAQFLNKDLDAEDVIVFLGQDVSVERYRYYMRRIR